GAILGAVAAGAYGDVGEAVSVMVRSGETYEPDPGRSRIYKERLALYRQIYPAIAGISHGLGE
ncbi:MAG: sugar kinase, partial [Lachnospiraceae bacterium]|nr:sugar kinase [Lachnospiraceae bacterium]